MRDKGVDVHNCARIPLTGYWEQDYLTPWRHFLYSDRGRSKCAKQKYNRRFRRKVRQSLREEAA